MKQDWDLTKGQTYNRGYTLVWAQVTTNQIGNHQVRLWVEGRTWSPLRNQVGIQVGAQVRSWLDAEENDVRTTR